MDINRDNYRSFNAVNFSLLSKVDFDPSQVKIVQKETEALSFGSLFDCLMTEPDKFNERYIISEVNKPTAQLGEYIDLLIEYKNHEDAYKEMKNRNPKLRDSLEKFKERVETEGKKYLEFYESSKEKQVVSKQDYYLALTMKESLLTNQFTSPYFNMDFFWEVNNQHPLEAEIDGILYKCLVDRFLINSALKKIIPIDIKTTGEYPNAFMKSVWKYRYYLQGALYWDIIQRKYPDYEVADFLFFVCSKELPQKPYIWSLDEKTREIGRNGGFSRTGQKIRGYKELANDLQWHEQTGQWEYPKTVYDNGGISFIEL